MNRPLTIYVLVAFAACRSPSSRPEQAVVDTTMVFISLPPPSAADSANAPSTDSVLATIRAYRDGRIAADVAAPVIVDYLLVGGTVDYGKAGGSTTPEREQDLHRAVTREFQRRATRK